MTVEAFRHANGAAEFTCLNCGCVVYSPIYLHRDCICLTCQFIRENPDLSESTKRLQRGDQS
jgi:hypothetical protein